MGDPYVFTHEGREIKLCCKGCLKDFNKDSAKFVKKIEKAETAAIESQRRELRQFLIILKDQPAGTSPH